jgi:hypothetical protein
VAKLDPITIVVKAEYSFGFWTGVMCWVGLHGFIEDLMGKERYMRALEASWTDNPVWMWPAIVTLTLGMNLAQQYLNVLKVRQKAKKLEGVL